jgi:hypothetical protein
MPSRRIGDLLYPGLNTNRPTSSAAAAVAASSSTPDLDSKRPSLNTNRPTRSAARPRLPLPNPNSERGGGSTQIWGDEITNWGRRKKDKGWRPSRTKLQGTGVLMRFHFPSELFSLTHLQFLHKDCTVVFLLSPDLLETLMPRLTESTACGNPLVLMFLCSSQIVSMD